MWFWKANNLNSLADRDDGSKITGDDITKLITKRINGGILGLAQRQYYVRTAKRVFGI
jgi:predicted chitinase